MSPQSMCATSTVITTRTIKDFAGVIKHGQTTKDKIKVEYNTGPFTTGRDWW